MRVLALALLALAPGLVLLPPAAAQGDLLSDPAGDVVGEAGGAASPPIPPSDVADQLDLLSLAIAEEEQDLLVAAKVKRLGGASSVSVDFLWNDASYRLTLDPRGGMLQQEAVTRSFWCLFAGRAGEWDRVECGREGADAASGTLMARVPKFLILDGNNRLPGKGDALEDIRVESRREIPFFLVDEPPRLVDRMPDAGEGATYTIQAGDVATGHLLLTSPDPIRVSNGGATTFVYRVVLQNNREADDLVDLAVADLPEGWEARVHTPLRIAGKSTLEVQVLASVPFAHVHGGFDSFNVTAESTDGASRARLRLGVLHTPIPQPAGHHPEVYLHAESRDFPPFTTVFPFIRGYLNTESSHEGDVASIRGNGWGGNQEVWFLPFNPRLLVGLDFDVNRTGTLDGQIQGHTPGAATLTPRLLLLRERGGDDDIVLARADPLDVTLDPQAPTSFSFDLQPTPEADYVPYDPEQYLRLELVLERQVPPARAAVLPDPTATDLLVEGFKMVLPLEEYHDRLGPEAELAAGIHLRAQGPVERLGRPGTTLTFPFDLHVEAAADVVLEAVGNDAEHAELAPAGPLPLGAGENRTVLLAVHVPANAGDGEEMEVLLFAYAGDDPTRTAIARVKITVTHGADAAPDEASALAAAKGQDRDTPGVGVAAALVILGLLAARRRR